MHASGRMIERCNDMPGLRSRAVFSGCGAYRYSLSRRWEDGSCVNFVMLNPSTADECRNDPTVERCERRARQMGFGAFSVTNLFAWRATDPRDLRRAGTPEGPRNDEVLVETAAAADLVIAAWGVHGAHRGRGARVACLLRGAGCRLHHLGLSRAGYPRHPLYVPYARGPEIWEYE
jgi:hypothetical protein